jgi:hypothetical protein
MHGPPLKMDTAAGQDPMRIGVVSTSNDKSL